ncbi:hypothetical protein GCM10020331_102490 [Ectobacillus funiculus]
MLQIVPNAGIIRLRDARDDKKLKEERQVTLQEGGIYHLKVKVVGDNIKVYWGGISILQLLILMILHIRRDFLALMCGMEQHCFKNVKVSELSTNLGSSLYKEGSWEPSIKGLKGSAVDGVKAKQIYNTSTSDFVLEGNVFVRSKFIGSSTCISYE